MSEVTSDRSARNMGIWLFGVFCGLIVGAQLTIVVAILANVARIYVQLP